MYLSENMHNLEVCCYYILWVFIMLLVSPLSISCANVSWPSFSFYCRSSRLVR